MNKHKIPFATRIPLLISFLLGVSLLFAFNAGAFLFAEFMISEMVLAEQLNFDPFSVKAISCLLVASGVIKSSSTIKSQLVGYWKLIWQIPKT